MRIKQIFLVIVAMAIFLPFQKVSASTLTTGLISYWNLDETSATRADSVSGNTLTNNIAVGSVVGKVGNAVNFTGINQYLNKTDNASLRTNGTDFTISFWVYLNSTTPQFIMTKAQATNVGEWGVYYDGSHFRFVTYSPTSTYDVSATSFGSPSLHTWYFVTVTHDSAAHTNSIQINNGTVDTLTGALESTNSTGGFLVGINFTGLFTFNGYIDEIGFWKKKLSVGEVSTLYNSGNGITYPFVPIISSVLSSPSSTSVTVTWVTNYGASSMVNYGTSISYGSNTVETDTSPRVTNHSVSLTGLSPCTNYHFQVSSTDAFGVSVTSSDYSFATNGCVLTNNLISFWKLDEASGIRYDSNGLNDLTENSVMTAVVGKLGYAVDAISTGKYLKASDNVGLSTGSTDFTLSGWFNLDSKTGVQVLLSKFQSGAAGEWALYYNSNTFVFTTYDSGSPGIGYPATASMTINSGTWYFIVAKHDSVNHLNTIQVNNGTVNTSVTAPEHLDSTAEFRVGEFTGANSALAKIDAVGFWKRLLGSNETDILYNSGNGSEYPFNISDIISPSILSISSTKANGTYTVGDTIDVDVTFSEPVTSAGSVVLTLGTGSTNETCSFTVTSSSTASCNYIILAGDTSADLDVISVNGIIHDVVGNKMDNFAQGSTMAQNKNLVISTVNSISVTSPKTYQVIQRNGSNQANIVISGTYTGSPAAIEASWNSGSYTTIVSSPTGGTFSGTLLNQTAGQGTLNVRFVNVTSTTSTVNYVGIGDIFVVAGQSNAAGYGFNNQTYTPSGGLKAVEFGNDDNWKELVDPLDDGTNQVDSVSYDSSVGFPKGSSWVNIASYFLADQNVPIAFIPTARDATAITQWLPGVDHSNTSTLYGSMHRRINAADGVKAVLFWQGESDAIAHAASSTYKTNLDTFSQSIQDDFGVKVVMVQIGEFSALGGTYINSIRQAQRAAWDQGGNVLPGPTLYDVNLADEGADGLHFRSDADIAVASARWWAALKADFYGGIDGRGPRLSKAEYNSAKTKIILTFTDETLPLVPSSTLSGFTVKDSGTPISIASASTTASNQVTIVLSSPASGALTVSLGDGNSGAGANVPRDSSVYNLPAEFFVDQVTTALVESVPVTSSIISNISTSSLQLNWAWGDGTEISYSVSSSINNSSWQNVSSGISTSTLLYTFSNGSLSPNTQYWFKVWSIGSEVNTSTDFGPAYTSSSLPTSFVVSNISTSTLTLSWNKNGNPNTTIYQISGDHNFVTTTVSATTTNLANLTPSTLYTFTINAQNAGNTSTYSTGVLISTTTLSTNSAPTITTISPIFSTNGSGLVTVTTTVTDVDNDTVSLNVDYSIDGGSTWTSSTLGMVAGVGNPSTSTGRILNVTSTAVGNNLSFTWNTQADGVTTTANTQLRITPSDPTVSGLSTTSSNFIVDNEAPLVPTILTLTPATSSIEMIWNDVFGASSYTVSSTASSTFTTINTTTTFLNLTPNSQYTFQVKAMDAYGNTSNFSSATSTTTLSAALPTVTTVDTSLISTSTATFNGNITSIGGATVSARGFVYGTSTNYGTTSTASGSFGTGAYFANINSFSSTTVYHYKAFASNTNGTSYGSDAVFSTISIPTASVPITTITSDNIVTTTISVTSDITNASVDFSSITASNSTTLPGALSVDLSTSLGEVTLIIPSGTFISASSTWSGDLVLPTVQSPSIITNAADTGFTATVSGVVEVGFGDVALTLNKSARILIPGMSGKLAGYSRSGVFTKIPTICSVDTQISADSQLVGNTVDCAINSGSDLVIWTKHFTKFVAYTQTQNVVNNGGGGGSYTSSPSPQAIIPTVVTSTLVTSTVVTSTISTIDNTTIFASSDQIDVVIPELLNSDSQIIITLPDVFSYQPTSIANFQYTYTNTSDKSMKIVMKRELLNENGKIIRVASASPTLKTQATFNGNVKEKLNGLKPGEYTFRIRIIDQKTKKVLEENGFKIQVEKLKQKYFNLGEIVNEDSVLSFVTSSLAKVKSNVVLPVNIKLRYGYTNETDQYQLIRMVRSVVDKEGNVMNTTTGIWHMKVGENYIQNVIQNIGINLLAGEYTVLVVAKDWNTGEVFAENGVKFNVDFR